jgi:hypothetical protein
MLAWGKDHLPPKRIPSKEQCRLSFNDDDLPSNVHEPWKTVTGELPEIPTFENATEQSSLRIHLSRINDRLKVCDCPCPEQGPLCMVPSVTTTITGGYVDAAAQKTNLSSRILEWTSGLEKHARTMIHDPYTLCVSTFTTNPCSNTLPSNLDLTEGAGHDRLTTTSSLKETVMTIQYSSTITVEDELVPGAIKKTNSRRSTVSQPSDDGSISERGSRDRIRILETRRDALTRRRASIENAIYNLLWHSQPCFGPYDMAAREEVKKLNSELVDTRRDEHDIGMNLFRALRSQDEDHCGGGSSSLWVSRVTR